MRVIRLIGRSRGGSIEGSRGPNETIFNAGFGNHC